MTILILAAGASRRMGCQKLLLPIDGRPMIEHTIAAAAGWPTVIVAGAEVADSLGMYGCPIVRNDAPERGMTHSLELGNAVVPAREGIAILLGDIPDVSPTAIAAVAEAYNDTIDVVVPRCGTEFGHPVVFGPRARRRIAALPDGDLIWRLRDDPQLERRIIELDPAVGVTKDIDTPAHYAWRCSQLPTTDQSSR